MIHGKKAPLERSQNRFRRGGRRDDDDGDDRYFRNNCFARSKCMQANPFLQINNHKI
jgi:hypothetical protein